MIRKQSHWNTLEWMKNKGCLATFDDWMILDEAIQTQGLPTVE